MTIVRLLTPAELTAADSGVSERAPDSARLSPPDHRHNGFSSYLGSSLRAVHTIDEDRGVIEGADATAVSNPWPATITFDSAAQLWQKTP